MDQMFKVLLRPLTKYYRIDYPNGLMFISTRPFNTSQHVLSQKKFTLDSSKLVKKDGTVVKKKTEQPKLITLVLDSTEKVLTMADALKLADHKGLHLIKIEKPKSKSMDFYQLSKVPQMVPDQSGKKKVNIKEYAFKVNIAEHDLLTKARGLIGALKKYKIAIYTIASTTKDPQKIEEISDKIQKAISNAGINFQITSSRGSHYYKVFTVEIKEENIPSVDNVTRAQNKEGSEETSQSITSK